MNKFPRKFYQRSTIEVAISLLGCDLIVNENGTKTGGKIVETEAYIGEDDPACHASHGRTKRNEIMYGTAGHLYVYFTYGNHFMLNVVTEKDNYPAAVLLRAIEPLYNIKAMAERRKTEILTNIASGPGKLAKALRVGKDHNGIDLCGGDIFINEKKLMELNIEASIRIGIGDKGSDKLWRFFISGNENVTPASREVKSTIVELSKARKVKFAL